jgi:hypothetical protein
VPFIQVIGFIQAGTEEALGPSAKGPIAVYDAWWADTVSHYRARHLFAVHPGDQIQASLVHRRGTWVVAIRDATTGRGARFATEEEGHGAFNLAVWAQERSARYPYPRLSPVTFEQLHVNGRSPDAASLLSSWLSTPEGLLAPSPLRGDAFTLASAEITREGQQYLRITRPLYAPALQLRGALARWRQGRGSWQLVRTDQHGYALAQERTGVALAAAHWSTRVDPLIRELVRVASAYARRIGSLPTLEPASRGRFLGEWTRDTQALSGPAHRLRRALGVPDPS